MVSVKTQVTFWTVGILTFILGLAAITVIYDDKLSFSVDADKTTFKECTGNCLVDENGNIKGRWEVIGRYKTYLYEGTTQLRRNGKDYSYLNDSIIHYAIQDASYKQNMSVKTTCAIDESETRIEKFPTVCKIETWNAKGKFLRWYGYDLEYTGIKHRVNQSGKEDFGRDMSVEYQTENLRWGWVYAKGSIELQYNITSNYQVFYVRMFDPPKKERNGTVSIPRDPDAYVSRDKIRSENITIVKDIHLMLENNSLRETLESSLSNDDPNIYSSNIRCYYNNSLFCEYDAFDDYIVWLKQNNTRIELKDYYSEGVHKFVVFNVSNMTAELHIGKDSDYYSILFSTKPTGAYAIGYATNTDEAHAQSFWLTEAECPDGCIVDNVTASLYKYGSPSDNTVITLVASL